jgi:D-beta-D-heptose 7-phosphate kinase/D-beta-D-heptose 1-phosphate adenosyltransferase
MKLLTIGDGMLDYYVWGIIKRQSPENQNIPIVDFVDQEYRLGGAFNVAANLWSLSNKNGNEVYVSSIISDFTSALLKEAGIFYDEIVLQTKYEDRPHERELIKTRIVRSDDGSQLIRVDNREKFAESDLQRYKNKCCYHNFVGFDAIAVSDYNKGVVDKSLIEKLEGVTCPVFVDTKKPNLAIWKNIKNCYIKINSKEYEASKNANKTNHLIVTQGKEGCSYYVQGLLDSRYSTDQIEIEDVTGAGDSFFSCFILSMMEGYPITESMKRANKAATISCTKLGTSVVDRSEI